MESETPGARVALLAACAFALASVLNALAGVAMALVGLTLLILSLGPRAAPISRKLADHRLTAAVIAVALVAILVPYSIGPAPPGVPAALPWLAIALGAWHLSGKGARHLWAWAAPAVLVTGIVAGIQVMRAAIGTGIDVVLLHEAAASALLRGENIYGPAVAVPNGAPGVPPGSMIVGYPYPPIAAAAYVAGAWVFADPRWTNLAAWAAMAGWTFTLARRHGSMLPFLVVAALPGWVAMLQSGWTEMLSAALVTLAAVSWANPVASGVALGLAFASKQYFALALPLLLLHKESRSRRAPVALAALAIAVLPPFLLAPADAWRSMVLWHARTPPRLESVTLMGALAQGGIHWSPPAWLALAAGPLVMIVMARRAAGPSGFWRVCAAGLAVFFLLSSQAMPNYWYLIAIVAMIGTVSDGTGRRASQPAR